jgi:putative phage-type endonuclease
MTTDTKYQVITTEPPGSPAWLDAHKGRIGGSDIACILGVGRKTPLRFWAEWKGKIEREDISKLPHIRRGVALEPVVKTLYTEVTNRPVLATPGLIAHPTLPWLAGTPDGMVEINGDLGVFEAKTMGFFKKKDWADEAVPLAYQIQVHLYMILTGTEKASIAAMPIDDDEDEEPVLWRDMVIQPVFADLMMDKVQDFYERHLMTDIPPEGNWEKDRETVRKMFPREEPGRVIEMDSYMVELWAQKEALASQKTAISKELEAVVAQLEAQIGTAEMAVGPGWNLKFKEEIKHYKATEAREVKSRQIRKVKAV